MDRYRPPASLPAITQMLVEQHAAQMLAQQREAELAHAERFLSWKFVRGCLYLIGGVVATLVVNGRFPMPLPVLVGAGAAFALSMCWFLIGQRTYWRFGAGPALAVSHVSALAHTGVLVWCWMTVGPHVAVPWFFIQMGFAGVISSIARFTKLPQ